MEELIGSPMKDTRGYITLEQAHALIDCAIRPRDKLLFKTLFYTGRRVSEVVGQWGIMPININFEGGFITFNILKKNPRKKDKTIPRPPPVKKSIPVFEELLDNLKKYIHLYGIRENDPVFNMSVRNVEYIVEKVGLKASEVYPELFPDVRDTRVYIGSKPLQPKNFRHGFTIHLAKNMGGTLEDTRQLQLLMQHSDLKVTQEYLKYSITSTKKLLNKVFGQTGVADITPKDNTT